MLIKLKNNWFWILLLLFILTRFLGLDQFYHQDEYRWVSQVYTEEFGSVDSPHPPIAQALLSLSGRLVGYDYLRIVPFIFGILSMLLIYMVSFELIGNKKIAYLAAGLYVVNIYSLIASLMIDIDGTLMPFLALSSYYFYLRLSKDRNKKFMLPLIVTIVAGLFTKLSFVLFGGALIIEYLWNLYDRGVLRVNLKKTILMLASMGVFITGAYIFYGSLDPRFAEYTTSFKFFNFGSRAYFELFLRLFKFGIWFSPLLLLPMLYGLFKKDIFTKYRIWYIYALFNSLFYLVIFDFARLPIERYFMFIIAPAVLIGAHVIYPLLSRVNKKHLITAGLSFVILVTAVAYLDHEVIPLNPKDAYVDKVKSLDFNFLIPLTGGSGPIGFYSSAQFILWSWVLCSLWLIFSRKKWFISVFIIFGFGYNILLSVENLTGVMYGSVDKITKQSVEYVINNPEINGVITYYDAGVYYLLLADKYDARFYTAPSRNYTERMNAYRGHYMVVDFPAIDKGSTYWEIISRCSLDQKFSDKFVDSYIFDCRLLPKASS